MSIILKYHNQKAYEKLKEKFKKSNKVAIIHPTGTGKSYIALELLRNNKQLSAIYVAPSPNILHNLKKSIFEADMNMSDFPNLRRITYSKLANMTDEKIKKLSADIIILDEFHHCGAPEWGRGVNRLLTKNKKAKVLGLSATPIRYFDSGRDMAEELFEGNVASEMSLEEAINEGILPEATYVSALYAYNAELSNMENTVSEIKDVENKKEATKLLGELRDKLNENTQNLPDLLSQYMKKNGKYIVFCKNIEDMKEKIATTQNIFSKVNSNITVYEVSSENDLKKNERTLKEFEEDDNPEALKLIFAVNMLNEGYHIKDLDGVIMMRPTRSPTLFTQQLGRALTVKKEGNTPPVILDLVNNFDNCKIIEDFTKKISGYGHSSKKDNLTNKRKSNFTIFDKTKEFRVIADKITQLSKRTKISLDEKIEIFSRFLETGEELTTQTIFEGYPIGQWKIQIRSQLNTQKINLSDEQIRKINELGILEKYTITRIDEKIDAIRAWIQKYPNLKVIKYNYKQMFEDSSADELRERFHISEDVDLKEYYNMITYYVYMANRKAQGKLTEEQIKKCKNANMGGVFGYSDDIEDLMKKYKIDADNLVGLIERYDNKEDLEKEIQDLSKYYRINGNKIACILKNYKTMDNFIRKYMWKKLSQEDEVDCKSMSVLHENLRGYNIESGINNRNFRF